MHKCAETIQGRKLYEESRYTILPVAWIFEAMAPMGVSSLMDAVNTF